MSIDRLYANLELIMRPFSHYQGATPLTDSQTIIHKNGLTSQEILLAQLVSPLMLSCIQKKCALLQSKMRDIVMF